VVVTAVIVAVVYLARKKKAGHKYRISVAGAAPVIVEPDPVHKKATPIDWEGIDDSEETATSAGIPFTGGRAETLPIEAAAKTDIEVELREMQEHIEENEYKPGIYKSEYDNAPKRKASATFSASQKDTNLHKNRYRDILPYDDTRVHLLNGEEDYINANHVAIRVGKQQFWYIASQGPLASTVPDFWQMVWENQARVIGMVSAEVEKGVLKCNPYWPSREGPEGTMTYGNLEVTLSRSISNEAYTIRGLSVKYIPTGEKRAVWQLQYTGWPDHGVPSDPRYFLAFLDELHNIRLRVSAGNTSVIPTVIHCSAGIGRTGVLILVEIALARLSAGLKPNLGETLKEIREQRPAMVQTVEQYKFAYEAVIAAMQIKVHESITHA